MFVLQVTVDLNSIGSNPAELYEHFSGLKSLEQKFSRRDLKVVGPECGYFQAC